MKYSGLTPETLGTSLAAAIAIEGTRKAITRAQVRAMIETDGTATDDEIIATTGLIAGTVHPRRGELWEDRVICPFMIDDDHALTRTTRSHSPAVVWMMATEAARLGMRRIFPRIIHSVKSHTRLRGKQLVEYLAQRRQYDPR